MAIKDLPLGSRVLADNPRPEEFDDTWPEPVAAESVLLSLDLFKADGTVVKGEFLRPREWVERLGLSVGGLLPVGVSELDIDCEAVVTGIAPCPEIAQGEGRVVTGRFVTRSAGNVVLVSLANGTEIRATDVHPVWSVDREEWVPAGELEPGEQVDTLAGPVAVLSVERLESALDVYNIEVHGEHVFRVTADGVLVHNACEGHHSIAKFLGGLRKQDLVNLPTLAHRELHALLRNELKLSGFPLRVGGTGGSAADWRRYFAANPGSQSAAFDALLRASRAVDAKWGTEATQFFWRNMMNGNYIPFP